MFDLSGKVAFITGAGGILGSVFCQALLDFGANVYALDISSEALEKLHGLNQGNGKLLVQECDLSDKQQVTASVRDAVSKFGKIDVLLNNAAAKTKDLKDFFADDVDYTEQSWRDVMAVNLDGAFWVLQAVGKQMIEQKQGSIIQTGSIYGAMGADQRIYDGSEYLGEQIRNPAVYAASKSGIIGLTRHFAAAWAEHGIRVNTVSPGGISSGQNNVFEKKYSARIPLNRMAQREDLIGAMIYLASDASSYVTGQNIMVDGGLSAW